MEMKNELFEELHHQDLYNHALNWSLEHYNQATNRLFSQQHATEQIRNEQQQFRVKCFEDFLSWSHCSKARSLLEVFGLRSKVPASIASQLEHTPESASMLARERALILQIVNTNVEKKYELQQELLKMRNELRAHPITKPIMDVRDGVVPTINQFRAMVNELGPNVVVVDYIHIQYQESYKQKMAIKMVVYRKGIIHDRIWIRDINMNDVREWVNRNIKGKDKETGSLSYEIESSKQLKECAKLIEPLARSESQDGWLGLKAGETLTKPGDTIVFCPAKFLHQTPLHALPLNGVPLIVRNPVVYCQSLPTLRTTYELYKDRRTGAKSQPKTTIIHSLPSDAESARQTERLAGSLQASFHYGVNLTESQVLDEFDGSTVIYYHGHVEFKEHQAMESELALDHDRPHSPTLDPQAKPPISRRITAQKIWDMQVHSPPYHVHIIGCRSGRAQHLGADDLLGFPTAFQFIGSTSVVSTLWKTRDLDGADFSEAFFGSLRAQKDTLGLPLPVDAELDLALAVQEAVKALLRRTPDHSSVESRAAYHWAGFVMHGYWKIPAWCVEFREG